MVLTLQVVVNHLWWNESYALVICLDHLTRIELFSPRFKELRESKIADLELANSFLKEHVRGFDAAVGGILDFVAVVQR